ncbi:unnamed protein product [Ectocarpus sp. CCAP 1310/34]|nr:unnamed protein product [Ectocarpus sp. CCAP 1310/34]
MDASESGSRLSCPNKLPPDELEGILTGMLTENVQSSLRDLLQVQGMLNGYLTEEQAAHLNASRIALELGPRKANITAGISPLLVLDEVIGRRLAMQLDRMGYRGRRLVIYEASGGRHELSIREAISLLPLCRELDIPSTVTLTGIEVAPGTMQPSLSTFPIIELHCLPSMGQRPPPIEAISPTIDTGKYVQVQALSVTKAAEISRSAGSVVASGHGGVRSRKYDGETKAGLFLGPRGRNLLPFEGCESLTKLFTRISAARAKLTRIHSLTAESQNVRCTHPGLTVDVSLPGVTLRRGCSCSEEEARAWARDCLLPSPTMDATDADADGVVFLCRVVNDRNGRRFPVLSSTRGGDEDACGV